MLVALPLCLGISLASGAPLFSGIIAGIVGGIVVTSISGSSLVVSGPAAGLAVIVLQAIQTLGSFEVFLVAVVLGGLLQLILGFLQAGIIGYYFPSSVIKGMLSGIGIIIFLKQIPHAFGYDEDFEGDLAFAQPDGENTITELFNMINYIHPGATIITVVCLAILILWEQPFMKQNKIMQWFQGPLVAVIAGIALNLSFSGSDSLAISANHIVNVPVAGSIGEFFSQFSLPDFSQMGNSDIYVIAITIAVVASLETLLCVEATDKLDPYKRITPTNLELKAQGIGNMVSGMIGGLPVTQVIVRSSANIQSGGRTKASAFMHGVLMLICAMTIPHILNLIPLASLAAILLVVGYKLAKPSLFKQMYAAGKRQFVPFIATILGIVFTDLLIGIGIGMAIGVFQILFGNLRNPYIFNPDTHEKGKPIHIKLSQQVSFLNKVSIQNALESIPEKSEVLIDASQTIQIHPDVIEIIHDFEKRADQKDIKVTIVDLQDSVNKSVDHLETEMNKIHEDRK